ncbi:hypothetical protein [Roseobacter weihaiensis]|uniref:hypothetical protein n=1 Tax=Roseobacter weihaiensis TaxID=2763262 RepID=UPI001D0BE19D|nr:hypothetical protein [Roseobacter sp. H9]
MTQRMIGAGRAVVRGILAAAVVMVAAAAQADISRFVGDYVGSADLISADGTTQPRDMSVQIRGTDEAFTVSWTSTSYRGDGSSKDKSYTIEFVPSDRTGVFSSAMTRNVFGHSVQLNPMKGEPYVWSRIVGDTLSVYSLYVTEDGGYEIQEFDRTLAPGGLNLDFQRVRNGDIQRTVSTFLRRK